VLFPFVCAPFSCFSSPSLNELGYLTDLTELSPVAFRSSFPGITYQIGNMISSPSAQIVNAIAESTFLTRKSDGKKVEAYGPTMGTFSPLSSILRYIMLMGITCV